MPPTVFVTKHDDRGLNHNLWVVGCFDHLVTPSLELLTKAPVQALRAPLDGADSCPDVNEISAATWFDEDQVDAPQLQTVVFLDLLAAIFVRPFCDVLAATCMVGTNLAPARLLF